MVAVAHGPFVLLCALGLDLLLGDPPNRYHPVAWMGQLLGYGRRCAPRRGQWGPLAYGAVLVLGGMGCVVVCGLGLEQLFTRLPVPLGWLGEAWLLKTTFALRGLARATSQVESALRAGDLARGQHLVSWHLVSRDTTQLTAPYVAAATIESAAENTSDGVVAPLLYYVIGGLPAALAYRFLNTADAMLGYRDPIHEWLGKVPARLDDLANLIPARLTAFLLILSAWLLRADGYSAWAVWRRDAGLTASPNAGHPMSAMAGALHVELAKVGHYRLGVGAPTPTVADIARARHLVYATVALTCGVLIIILLVQAL